MFRKDPIMIEAPIFPPEATAPLRVYTRNGSYLITGDVVDALHNANHESEANVIFLTLAIDVPKHDRCHVWRKCRQ